ncbi:MAG: YccF domain-containing protein, partial [Gammaproteobacteria bacterium]
MSPLALLLNVLWIFFGGGLSALVFWTVGGVLLAITVVGLPFSFAAFRLARFAFVPFGQRAVPAQQMGGRRVPGTLLANILWFVLAGVWLWLYHVVVAIGLCLTIIGIPFGIANFRLAGLALRPLGRRVVLVEELMPRT